MLSRILAVIASTGATAFFVYTVLTMRHGKGCYWMCPDQEGAGDCQFNDPSCVHDPYVWWLLLFLSLATTIYSALVVLKRWNAK
jgi:hypothetical protein